MKLSADDGGLSAGRKKFILCKANIDSSANMIDVLHCGLQRKPNGLQLCLSVMCECVTFGNPF